MWVEFEADFDFHPEADARLCIAYKAGMRCQVTREAFDKAPAAKRIPNPSKADALKLLADPYWRPDEAADTPSEQGQV